MAVKPRWTSNKSIFLRVCRFCLTFLLSATSQYNYITTLLGLNIRIVFTLREFELLRSTCRNPSEVYIAPWPFVWTRTGARECRRTRTREDEKQNTPFGFSSELERAHTSIGEHARVKPKHRTHPSPFHLTFCSGLPLVYEFAVNS
jgi:hypothetical protein